MILERDGLQVRADATRGDWALAVEPSSFDDFYDPRTWAAFLDGVPIPSAPPRLRRQARFVRRRLADVKTAAETDPRAEETIRSIGETWARRRLGLPPP